MAVTSNCQQPATSIQNPHTRNPETSAERSVDSELAADENHDGWDGSVITDEDNAALTGALRRPSCGSVRCARRRGSAPP